VKRRLFNAGALVSLVLCVAVITLWVLSYSRMDVAWFTIGGRREISIYSFRGQMVFHSQAAATRLARRGLDDVPKGWYTFEPPGGESNLKLLTSFGLDAKGFPSGVVHLPHWSLVLFFAIAPIWNVSRRVRSARGKGCVCPACGYDLRGTPSGASGGTCPECGFRPPEPPEPPEGAVSSSVREPDAT
jgi:hypothetical protein